MNEHGSDEIHGQTDEIHGWTNLRQGTPSENGVRVNGIPKRVQAAGYQTIEAGRTDVHCGGASRLRAKVKLTSVRQSATRRLTDRVMSVILAVCGCQESGGDANGECTIDLVNPSSDQQLLSWIVQNS